MNRWLLLMPAALLLIGGCATWPTGPSVMVLPGAGKGFEEFQFDDAVCRNWALERTGGTPGKAATDSAVSGAAIGTAVGAASGAAIGAAAGAPGVGAAVGSGVGLLGGTAVGGSYADAAGGAVQYRYDVAYMQCMYSKGNQIPVRGQFMPPARATRPPPPMGIPAPPAGNPPPPPPGA